MSDSNTSCHSEHQASHLGPKASLLSYFDELLTEPSSTGSNKAKATAEPSCAKTEATETQIGHNSAPLVATAKPNLAPPSQSYTASHSPADLGVSAHPTRKTADSLPVNGREPMTIASEQRVSSNKPQGPAPKLKRSLSIDSVAFAPEPEIELKEAQKQKLQHLLSQQTLHAEPILKAKTVLEAQAETKIALKTQVKIETDTVDTLEAAQALVTSTAEPELDIDNAVEVEDAYQSALASKLAWADNGRPQWAQKRFEALLFDVSGLTLAVPLISLGQIVPITDELTPIFGQSDWFMGIMPNAQGQLRLINTALFVMPEKYNDKFLQSAAYAISIDGVPWALAVDKVNQPISLEPSEINWRGQRSKRPWLAGTVKSAMCALLDIPNMAHLLNQSDKKLSI